MPMTEDQKAEKAEKIRQLAIHYAAHPEEGEKAGFRPKPRTYTDPTPNSSFDRNPPQVIPLDSYDWVLLIAKKELGPAVSGGREIWFAQEPIEGPESLTFEII